MTTKYTYAGETFEISFSDEDKDCRLEVKYGDQIEIVQYNNERGYFTGGNVANNSVPKAVENACKRLIRLAKPVDGCGPIKDFYEELLQS